MTERIWTPEEIQEILDYNRKVDPRDNRKLLPGMHPRFRDHNCARCHNGSRACVEGNPSRCSWPHARND